MIDSAQRVGERAESGEWAGVGQRLVTPPSAVHAPGGGGRHHDVMTFDELFDAEYAIMLRPAHLLGAADPENIAQEAFCRIHARWDELADRERAGGYLRTTVVNLCRSAGRRRAVERRHTLSAGHETAPAAEAAVLDRVATERLLAAVLARSLRTADGRDHGDLGRRGEILRLPRPGPIARRADDRWGWQ